jgi:hypothetical protein
LLHDDDIDCAAECRRVDAIPSGRNAGAEASNVVHGCVVVLRSSVLLNEWMAVARKCLEIGGWRGPKLGRLEKQRVRMRRRSYRVVSPPNQSREGVWRYK